MVSPNQLVDEALDRGFKSSGHKSEEESEDEISKEKKDAARRHYGSLIVEEL